MINIPAELSANAVADIRLATELNANTQMAYILTSKHFVKGAVAIGVTIAVTASVMSMFNHLNKKDALKYST